jgi:hypothetical protein
MSHLDIIKEAYDRCGIAYVVRVNPSPLTDGEWCYLFLSGPNKMDELKTADLDYLMRKWDFMEFNNGEIVSY